MATKVKSAREDEALLGLDVSLLPYVCCFMNRPDQLMKVESLGSNKTFHINQVVDVLPKIIRIRIIEVYCICSSSFFYSVLENLSVDDSFTILRFLPAIISSDLYLRDLAL